jgi:hypothetical protein
VPAHFDGTLDTLDRSLDGSIYGSLDGSYYVSLTLDELLGPPRRSVRLKGIGLSPGDVGEGDDVGHLHGQPGLGAIAVVRPRGGGCGDGGGGGGGGVSFGVRGVAAQVEIESKV